MQICKICQEPTTLFYEKKREVGYFRCKVCGFISLDDKHMVQEEEEKKHYAKHNNSFESTGYVKMFENFIEEAIKPYLSNLHTVLEYGCGHGPVLAKLLSQKGLNVDLYDFYFFPEKIYEKKSYDLITSTEVFEHLKDPMLVLKTLVSSLKTNGYLILMTQFPNKSEAEFLKWWYIRDITHISFFTPKSFEIMAEKVGLKVLKTMNDNVVVFQKC